MCTKTYFSYYIDAPELYRYGSASHSSVSLYSSLLNISAYDDTIWNAIESSDVYIEPILRSLSVQDNDLSIMYNEGPSDSLMLYTTVQVMNDTSNTYDVIHRVLPGLSQNYSTISHGESQLYIYCMHMYIFLYHLYSGL